MSCSEPSILKQSWLLAELRESQIHYHCVSSLVGCVYCECSSLVLGKKISLVRRLDTTQLTFFLSDLHNLMISLWKVFFIAIKTWAFIDWVPIILRQKRQLINQASNWPLSGVLSDRWDFNWTWKEKKSLKMDSSSDCESGTNVKHLKHLFSIERGASVRGNFSEISEKRRISDEPSTTELKLDEIKKQTRLYTRGNGVLDLNQFKMWSWWWSWSLTD